MKKRKMMYTSKKNAGENYFYNFECLNLFSTKQVQFIFEIKYVWIWVFV